MQKIILAIILCLGAGAVSVSAQTDYCFKNDGLKVKQTASFTVTGNKIDGTFVSGGYDTATAGETSTFTGLRHGTILTIKFEGKKPPYEVAPGSRRIFWTLGPRSLKIRMYGKNYVTNKYGAYTATFAKCKEI